MSVVEQRTMQGIDSHGNPLPLPDKENDKGQPGEQKTSTTSKRTGSNEFPLILRLLKLESRHLSYGIAALIVSSCTNLALPTIIGHVVDLVSGRVPSHTTTTAGMGTSIRNSVGTRTFLAGALASFFCGSIASFSRVYYFGRAQIGIANHMRKLLFSRMVESPNETGHVDDFPDHDEQTSVMIEQTRRTAARASANDSDTEEANLGVGPLIACLGQDVDELSKGICKSIASALRSCSSAFGGTAMLVSISPQLTLVTLSLVPVLACTAMMSGKQVKRLSRDSRQEFEEVVGFAEERLNMIRTVRLFGRETHETIAFAKLLDNTVRSQRKAAHADGMFMGALSFSINLSLLFVLYTGGRMVAKGRLSGGQLTSFGLYSGMVALGSSGLAGVYGDVLKFLGASKRVFKVLGTIEDGSEITSEKDARKGTIDRLPVAVAVAEEKADTTSRHNATQHSTSTSTSTSASTSTLLLQRGLAVEFRGVHFAYPERSDAVLRGVHMQAVPGEITGLAGESGAGKTTLVDLLVRILELKSPYEALPVVAHQEKVNEEEVAHRGEANGFAGSILLGGVDIRSLHPHDLRCRIGVVPQQPDLFRGTILDNILYGKLDACREEVTQAARAAGAYQFISEMPNGFDSTIDPNSLSVGQKQRIAICRVLLLDPPVVVMDEATSALDGESEMLLNRTLTQLKRKGKTILVVAHRRSTLLACDRVHVLSRGRVVESGDPTVLIRAGQSVFHRLVTGSGAHSPHSSHLPLHTHSMPASVSSMSVPGLGHVHNNDVSRSNSHSVGLDKHTNHSNTIDINSNTTISSNINNNNVEVEEEQEYGSRTRARTLSPIGWNSKQSTGAVCDSGGDSVSSSGMPHAHGERATTGTSNMADNNNNMTDSVDDVDISDLPAV